VTDRIILPVDVKNVQIKIKNVKNVKKRDKLKKTFVSVIKNVTAF